MPEVCNKFAYTKQKAFHLRGLKALKKLSFLQGASGQASTGLGSSLGTGCLKITSKPEN